MLISLCESLTLKTNLLIAGDFNFKMDKALDYPASCLKSMLDSLDLCQHVKGVTHEKGHTLDLLISRKMDDIVVPKSVCVSDLISDHSAFSCYLHLSVPKPICKIICYRKLKNIDLVAFRNELNCCYKLSTPQQTRIASHLWLIITAPAYQLSWIDMLHFKLACSAFDPTHLGTCLR